MQTLSIAMSSALLFSRSHAFSVVPPLSPCQSAASAHPIAPACASNSATTVALIETAALMAHAPKLIDDAMLGPNCGRLSSHPARPFRGPFKSMDGATVPAEGVARQLFGVHGTAPVSVAPHPDRSVRRFEHHQLVIDGQFFADFVGDDSH